MYKASSAPLFSRGRRATSTPTTVPQETSGGKRTHRGSAESLVLVSGYLTKRTRSVGQWKRRWWQLIGDGTLLYFKKADRHKMLGEIDIARTCYDVRLGAEQCAMTFPRYANPHCCFSFAVLKRTYYVYAPTATEARRWVDGLTSTSNLLCRRRHPRESVPGPTVVVSAEMMDSFAPSPPSSLTPPSPKPPLPRAAAVMASQLSSSTEEEEEASPTVYSLSQILNHPSYHYSVPDLRFDESMAHSRGGNPGLWLDGSPGKHQGHHEWPLRRERAMSQLMLANAYSNSSNPYPRDAEARRATVSSGGGGGGGSRAAKRASANFAFCDIPEHEVVDGDFGGGMGGTLPRQSKSKHPSPSTAIMADLALSSSYERLEKLQEREDAIRLRLRELEQRTKAYSKRPLSFPRGVQPLATSTSSYVPSVLPSMATEARYSSPEGTGSGGGGGKLNDSLPTSDSSPRTESVELGLARDRVRRNPPETTPRTPPKMPKTPPRTPPKMPKTPPRTSPKMPKTPPRTPPKMPKTPPRTPPKMPKTPPKTPPKPARTPPKTPPKPAPKMNQTPPPARLEVVSSPPSRGNEGPTAGNDVARAKSEPPQPASSPQQTGSSPANRTLPTTSPGKEAEMSRRAYIRFWGSPTKSPAGGVQEPNKWTQSEIRKLIAEMKRAGHVGEDGCLRVTFGTLLELSEIKFEALLGTLLMARRHKVVQFEGEGNIRASNDGTTITLLAPDF